MCDIGTLDWTGGRDSLAESSIGCDLGSTSSGLLADRDTEAAKSTNCRKVGINNYLKKCDEIFTHK